MPRLFDWGRRATASEHTQTLSIYAYILSEEDCTFRRYFRQVAKYKDYVTLQYICYTLCVTRTNFESVAVEGGTNVNSVLELKFGFYIRLSSYYECTCHQYCSDMLI